MAMNLNTILTQPEAPAANAPAPAADPAVQAPAPSPAPAEWLQSLPEAYRADPNITAHSGLDSVLAEYNALKTVGGKLDVPPLTAPYEAHKEFFTKLGVPESADAYGLAFPQDWPENFPVNQEALGKFAQVAHQYKVPAEALKAIANEYFGMEKAAIEQGIAEANQAAQANVDLLKQTWGSEFDTRAELARKGFGQFADANLTKALDESGVTGNPHFLHLMSEIGKAMQAPVAPGASSSSGSGVQQQIVSTPQQAQDAIKAMYADPVKGKAIMNPKDPNHKLYNTELEGLYAKAYPTF